MHSSEKKLLKLLRAPVRKNRTRFLDVLANQLSKLLQNVGMLGLFGLMAAGFGVGVVGTSFLERLVELSDKSKMLFNVLPVALIMCSMFFPLLWWGRMQKKRT
jgi:uncharacterized BrkB/YihY/UPF0761 family membrane protein